MHMHMNGVNNDDSNDLGSMPIDIGMLIEDTVVELFMFISLMVAIMAFI